MKRPEGVTAKAGWDFVEAFFALTMACMLIAIPFSGLYDDIGDPIGEFWVSFTVTCGVVYVLIMALALLFAGWGLLRLKGWARWLAFILAIFSLFAFPIGTVIGAFIIWYLLKEDVREAFEAAADAMYLEPVPPVDEVEST